MPSAGPGGRYNDSRREWSWGASAESFRDMDIETLNREHHLDIDAETCVSLWDGTRMNHALAVEVLLHRDGALKLDPATGHYPAHFPPAPQNE